MNITPEQWEALAELQQLDQTSEFLIHFQPEQETLEVRQEYVILGHTHAVNITIESNGLVSYSD